MLPEEVIVDFHVLANEVDCFNNITNGHFHVTDVTHQRNFEHYFSL